MLERVRVLLGDLLAEELVVAKGAEPELGDALRRLLFGVVALDGEGLRVDILGTLDDGRARGVERGVELGVLVLERALLLEELAVELVVRLLRLGERADAGANLVVQGLDESGAHADEVVELVLERADEAGVVAELAEGLEHLSLVDVGELRGFGVGNRGRSAGMYAGIDRGGHFAFAAADGGNHLECFEMNNSRPGRWRRRRGEPR